MENLEEKRILVTGGTGFIGKALCSALADSKADIIVLTRKVRAKDRNISFITSLSEINNQHVDIIINLAGEPIAQRWTKTAKEKIRASRIDTTSSLIKFIIQSAQKPSILISGSAIGYYGTDQQTIFDETSIPAQGASFSRSLCAAWEAEAKKAEQCGVRTVLLRIGAVLEKDGGMLAKLLPAFRLGLGGAIGRGDQWLSWIDRNDLIKLILHVIKTTSLHGPVNAVAPNPVTNAIFSQSLAQCLNRPCTLRTPAFLLRAIFGDMAGEILLEGQKALPEKALESGFSFSYPELNLSLEKILKTKNGLT